MTQPQLDKPLEPVLTRALAAFQAALIEERMHRTALELEVERLTQVCSLQSQEIDRLRAG